MTETTEFRKERQGFLLIGFWGVKLDLSIQLYSVYG